MSVESRLDNETLAADRSYLMAYARFKLRDSDLASDAVQETLLAAMEHKAQFAGRSSPRTWLVSILRNKIHDLLAARRGEVLVGTLDTESEDDGAPESVFDTQGRWGPDARPQVWGRPEAAMEQTEFWHVFQRCLEELPARMQEVFVLREILGEPIDTICKNLDITPSNCSVLLYRARMRLRPCLQARWFGAAG